MNTDGYCPMGSDTPSAPWNREDPKPVKVSVCISLSLSKTVEVEVDDYSKEEEADEDGNPITNYDFSQCDLRSAVLNQVSLPGKGWTVDEFETILDE